MTQSAPVSTKFNHEKIEFKNDEAEPQLIPLTKGQESLYILSRLAKESAVYNMPFAFRLRGTLNFRAFHNALGALIERHDALRTNIVETNKGLQQWTWSATENVALNFLDLSATPEAEKETSLSRELHERAGQPFELLREPPFRVDLIRLSNEEHVALFNLHHVFGDMASMQILFRDFSEIYNALVENRAPALAEGVVQFNEIAEGDQERNPPEETLKFWRERVSKMSSDLELPADFPRPSLPAFKGGLHQFKVSPSVAAGIKTLARTNKCSPYMAFLAVLQILVYRYTNQRNFAIATPFSSRHDPALENTVGYLVNLLPIPCAPRPRSTFNELLVDTRRTTMEVFGHQEISLRRILQEAKIPGDSPKNSLSRIVFQYFSEGPLRLEMGGIKSERINFHTGTSKFDVSITMVEENGAIETEIEYDSELFKRDTIESMGQRLLNLVESAVRNPDGPISELNLLTASEKCFLAELNETKTAYPREATVDQLFEQQVTAHPTKIALTCDGTAITYLELNRRADQVAHLLIRKGVRPGDFVGVCLERSPELVAALLGILKSGAAFVPFDAKYPAARLEYMFNDSGVRVLITNEANRHIASAGVEIIPLNDATAEPTERGGRRPLASPDSLAYMMYTSGSTGNPKGVTVPHRAIARLVRNNDFASSGPDEVFLLFAPISFDASTLEIWSPLLNGGALAIYPPDFESLDQFAGILAREKVTTLWLSSGLFNTVVDRKVEALKGLRQLLVGGDVVSPAHVQKAYAVNPELTIINGYGPTENTTFTCCYTIPRDWPADRAIPIGRPIRNTHVYILDENLQPMPVGVPGELYCGGDGLSHGYWNKPDLTAHAFVPHPFAAGSRLYKTGDRVRLLPDGNIEFLGRLDSQIKIRGFRIELGEIETAFRQLEGVQDAAAVVTESEGVDGKRLIAFVVAKSGRSLNTAELHEQVRKLMPEHACPSLIHLVEEFPLGPNGKVDKKALLALPAAIAAPATTSNSGLLTETEQAISRVWREILDVPAIGADENFFHLGGDSLRAIRAILQINRIVNANLGVSQIFEAPTIRALARKIDGAKQTVMPPIRKAKIEPIRRRDVSALSDAEVDAMLNQMLKKEK